MFEPPDELSSDLEWMLESGQVDRDLLAEALVEEAAIELDRLAHLYLGSAALARQVMVRALGAALVNVYRYRHGLGVRIWLMRFLVVEWRKTRPVQDSSLTDDWTAVDHQSPRLRELGVLVYGGGFSLQNLALILETDVSNIERLLKDFNLQYFLETGLKSGKKEANQAALDERLRRAAWQRGAAWNAPAPDLAALTNAVVAHATRSGARRGGLLRAQELGLVAIVIALAGAVIWGSGWLMAGEEAGPEPRVTLQTVIVEITTTPQPLAAGGGIPQVAPTPMRTAEASHPLSLESDSETIRRRIERAIDFRRSLWLDASLRFYYPYSREGVPGEYRAQIWLDRWREHFLVLSGRQGEPIQEIYLYLLEEGTYQAQRSEHGEYDFQELAEGDGLQTVYLAYQSLYLPMLRYTESDHYIPQELTRLLDRSVLVVDQVNLAGQRLATLWLDVNNGLALRQRHYNPHSQSPLLDVDLDGLLINHRLPEQVFMPQFGWRGAYPMNDLLQFETEIGETDPAAAIGEQLLPPAGFDPSSQALHFEFETIYMESIPDVLKDFLYHRASLFTEEYFLGKVDFADPWQVICTRSSDGSRLAFAETGGESQSLYWFNLSDLALQSHNANGSVTQLAFSPDGQRLAYFNAGQPLGELQVLDLQSGAEQTLLTLGDVRSLVWNPDGKLLGFIGREITPETDDRVMVVDVQTGYVVYE
ncbi:MAG TPA: hypothetical protein VN363_08620, partial [Anaerolineales bacterium]|nr:hypothetical protein [Anaerolineales bacterium]